MPIPRSKNINPESLAEELLTLYDDMNTTIDNNKDILKNTKCHKGCSNCCHHYFGISNTEMMVILDYIEQKHHDLFYTYINKGKELNSTFLHKFPRDYKDLDYIPPQNSQIALLKTLHNKSHISLPCVFLNTETNSCDIYEVRPFICRFHGLFFNAQTTSPDWEVCSHIPSLQSNLSNMIDGSTFYNRYLDNVLLQTIIIKGTEHKILGRLYPIFHLYYFMFKNSKYFNNILTTPKFGGALTYTRSEYMNTLKRFLGIPE